jgi:hypothetical protein
MAEKSLIDTTNSQGGVLFSSLQFACSRIELIRELWVLKVK